MAAKTDKNKVLEIVEGWDVGKEPEYRGFKCVNYVSTHLT